MNDAWCWSGTVGRRPARRRTRRRRRDCPSCWGWPCAATPSGPICWCRNVLGKHVPQPAVVVYGAGVALGRRVRDLLGDEAAARAVVLGYAETATGLGHCVADGIGARPLPALHPPPGRRRGHGGRLRGGPQPRHLSPAAARRTRTCWPATARWSSWTTSSRRAAPCSTRSATCTRRYPREPVRGGGAGGHALGGGRGPTGRLRRASSAPAWTWWRCGLGHGRACPDGVLETGPASWWRGTSGADGRQAARRTRRRPAAATRARHPATVDPRWTSAGPQGCRTAAGTASPRRTAPAWRPPSPPWPAKARGGTAAPRRRAAACSSSASRS